MPEPEFEREQFEDMGAPDKESYEAWEADRAARQRLRDAAPDLLEACRAMVQASEDKGYVPLEIEDAARAAIAKAVEPGGTP